MRLGGAVSIDQGVAWPKCHAGGGPRERRVRRTAHDEQLEPEVPNTSSVPRQVLPLVQSVEVVDREVRYGLQLSQAQIDRNPAATLFIWLQRAPVRDASAFRAEVKSKRRSTNVGLGFA